jgi:hypothetical protein
MGLNTKLAKTMVTRSVTVSCYIVCSPSVLKLIRCLVGITGITYKYLGIRMFSYPWDAGALGTALRYWSCAFVW